MTCDSPARQGARRAAVRIFLAAVLAGSALAETEFVAIPGGRFKSVLPVTPGMNEVTVAPFELAVAPVTNAEFLAFVTRNPRWRRGVTPAVLADGGYLGHWQGPLTLGNDVLSDQPVTHVSWFAAMAYCEEQGARLPTWYEWEYVAAADAVKRDARKDPAWRQTILNWYARPGNEPLPRVRQGTPNVYGIHDLHGAVWEWVADFNALMVSTDNREQGDPNRMKFCGAGALTMEEKENYAVLMRVAMLSSLEGAYTTRNLGFRCARDAGGRSK